jgi:hypothetical protein
MELVKNAVCVMEFCSLFDITERILTTRRLPEVVNHRGGDSALQQMAV